jgi:hypothetical protein
MHAGLLEPGRESADDRAEICRSGFTSRIRPPTSYTDPLKIASMRAYGLGTNTSEYEFDHLISLELGGAPSDIRNLWPESNYAPSFSYRKDGLENSLNAKVCSRRLSLAAAQRRIVHWVQYVSTEGAPAPEPEPTPQPTPTPTGNCDPAYPTVCIPPPPPDLDCGDISYRNFKVLPPDPHHFDGDGDGVGCES